MKYLSEIIHLEKFHMEMQWQKLKNMSRLDGPMLIPCLSPMLYTLLLIRKIRKSKNISLVLWIWLYCYQWWYVRLSGQIDFYNVCRGFCLLAVTKAAIRAKLFFKIIDTDGSGTISESEFEVFLKCVNAIDESNYTPEEIKVGLISVHRTLLWTNVISF